MLKDKKAIIFDLDGTLIDSMWIWPDIDLEYLAKYKLDIPPDFQKQIEGMSYTETAQYFLNSFPALDFTLKEIQQEWIDMTYEKYTTAVTLKSGVFEFLQDMKAAGIQLGIATSNTRTLVDATLEALQIGEFFQSVRTSCEVSAGKPAPDVYLKVAQDIGIDPCECLVFEDVPKGIEAGKNAGMTVCGVDDAFSRPDEATKKLLADYYIYDYADIKNKTYEILQGKQL